MMNKMGSGMDGKVFISERREAGMYGSTMVEFLWNGFLQATENWRNEIQNRSSLIIAKHPPHTVFTASLFPAFLFIASRFLCLIYGLQVWLQNKTTHHSIDADACIALTG